MRDNNIGIWAGGEGGARGLQPPAQEIVIFFGQNANDLGDT